MVIAWNKRACKLNARALSGKFTHIPKSVKVNSDLTVAMTLDWEEFTRQYHNSIKQIPVQGESEKVFKFGNESVKFKKIWFIVTLISTFF